jgi:DNA-directed RNA polymerase subunit RPC12/RpoP
MNNGIKNKETGMNKVMRCLYCDGPCKVSDDTGKLIMDCPNCGIKELTKPGFDRMEAKEKL